MPGKGFYGSVASAATGLAGMATRRYLNRRRNATVAAKNAVIAARNVAVAARKQARSKALVVTKTKNKYEDVNQYRQRETVQYRKGSKLRPSIYYRKLMPTAKTVEKYEYRNYELDRVNPNNLKVYLGQEAPAGKRYLPMYIFHLTGHPMVSQPAPCCFRAFYNTIGANTGIMDWEPTNGMDRSGAYVDNNWTLVNDNLNGSVASVSQAMLEYVDIRMTLQGPRNVFTRIVAQLINITDASVDPLEFYNTDTFAPGVSSAVHDKFWRQEVAPFTANQCQRYSRDRQRGYRVLGTKTFTLQPTSSTENDASGHEVHVKWFWRPNKIVDFRRGAIAGQTLADDLNTLNLGNQTDNTNSSAPKPTDRIYLLLRAYAPFTAVGYDNTIHPSYECSIVNKWTSMATTL